MFHQKVILYLLQVEGLAQSPFGPRRVRWVHRVHQGPSASRLCRSMILPLDSASEKTY